MNSHEALKPPSVFGISITDCCHWDSKVRLSLLFGHNKSKVRYNLWFRGFKTWSLCFFSKNTSLLILLPQILKQFSLCIDDWKNQKWFVGFILFPCFRLQGYWNWREIVLSIFFTTTVELLLTKSWFLFFPLLIFVFQYNLIHSLHFNVNLQLFADTKMQIGGCAHYLRRCSGKSGNSV